MAKVQLGDRMAYERLYERWRGPVFQFLLRRTGAFAAAEEAQQEAWLRVYLHRARYDVARPFRPWLYAIAVNAGRDARRPDRDLLVFDDVAGPDTHAHRDLLVTALHALDPVDRRLLLLAVEGFSGPEIGEIFALSAGAVRVRLTRARQRVRAALGEADDA